VPTYSSRFKIILIFFWTTSIGLVCTLVAYYLFSFFFTRIAVCGGGSRPERKPMWLYKYRYKCAGEPSRKWPPPRSRGPGPAAVSGRDVLVTFSRRRRQRWLLLCCWCRFSCWPRRRRHVRPTAVIGAEGKTLLYLQLCTS